MAKNPLKIIDWIWHMYNVPFDDAFGEIKDLSILSKLSVLSLVFTIFVFLFTPVNPESNIGNLIAGLAVILLLVLAVFWMGYFPFLIVRLAIYYLKKNHIIN